jgi:hypothetical protein
MPMPWFRYYSEIVRDRKLIMAAKCAGISKLEMIGAWSIILCLANDSPERGNLLVTLQECFSIDDIEIEFGSDHERTGKIICSLLKYEMLQVQDGIYSVKNWSKRQFDSDNSTTRVQKHREKQKETPDVTLQKRFGNAPETETESDTESDTDTEADTETETEARDAFSIIQHTIEHITGMMPDNGACKAINEIIAMGAVEEDLRGGYDWLTKNNKQFKYYSQLVGPTRTAMAMRTQGNHKGGRSSDLSGIHFDNVRHDDK